MCLAFNKIVFIVAIFNIYLYTITRKDIRIIGCLLKKKQLSYNLDLYNVFKTFLRRFAGIFQLPVLCVKKIKCSLFLKLFKFLSKLLLDQTILSIKFNISDYDLQSSILCDNRNMRSTFNFNYNVFVLLHELISFRSVCSILVLKTLGQNLLIANSN